MARTIRIFIFCLLLVVGTEAHKLPDYIKPCSRSDPKFNDCALKNGREAIPAIIKGDRKLGVPVLDPLFIERASMTHGSIQATSINFTIVGIKDAVLEAISVDFDRQLIKMSISGPRISLTGWYELRGNIMGMPMYGQGKYQMESEGPRGNYSTNYTLKQSADGEQYVVPIAYDIELDMDKMTVNFENLFNGNKLLGDTMNNLINQNWRVVLEDLGKPVFMAAGAIVDEMLKNVAQKVPYNELFTK